MPVPYQLLAAASAGLLVSAVCILAVIGALSIMNILLPSAKDKEEEKQ